MQRWLILAALMLPATALAQPKADEPEKKTDPPTTTTPTAPTPKATTPTTAPTPTPKPTPKPVSSEPTDAGKPNPDEPPVVAVDPKKDVNERQPGKVRGESSFMDVRLNLTLTNENLFAKPGETIPSVPGWRFGRPNSLGVLFFDNYDTRFSGYETLAHAVLYRQHTDKNWEVEGALVLRINDLAQNQIALSDAGSYIRVAYWKDPKRKDPTRLSLVAFPTSSDRMRLGYSYRLSWGGSPEYQRSKESVPGVKIQYDTGKIYGYVGAKSAVVLDGATAEEKAVRGYLAGFGIDITPMIKWEVNAGYFNRGSNELQDVLTEDVQLYGVSTQLAFHDGMPVGSSIDYTLYRNDPLRVGRLFRRAEYPGGLSWLVTSEFTFLAQTLKDPEATGSTKIQKAIAGDVNVRVKYNRLRFRLDAQIRDLAFILHSTPSLPTYSDFPKEYDQAPNLFLAAGVDKNFDDKLTVGVVVGLDIPATLDTPTGVLPGDTVPGNGRSTAVIRNEGDITILPQGEKVAPQFAVKFQGRLDFSEFFAALLDVYYTYDPNQTRLRRDGPNDLLMREFGEFNQLGVNLTLQAKF